MTGLTIGDPLTSADVDRLLAYVADLEVEVDRLRRQGRFIEQKAAETLTRILRLCTEPIPGNPMPALAEVEATARHLVEVVRDLHDPPGYHPSLDQVVAIAVRPLAEQVFRWQRHLTGAPAAALRLELKIDHVEWFPARLRHILDNLLGNALRRRDPDASEQWVRLGLLSRDGSYEIRVSDNGLAPTLGSDRRPFGLLLRSSAGHERNDAGLDLAVVRLLVEQSGGTVSHGKTDGNGTESVVTLPRYDLLDYLE
jgi:signal transduction histidine kinase